MHPFKKPSKENFRYDYGNELSPLPHIEEELQILKTKLEGFLLRYRNVRYSLLYFSSTMIEYGILITRKKKDGRNVVLDECWLPISLGLFSLLMVSQPFTTTYNKSKLKIYESPKLTLKEMITVIQSSSRSAFIDQIIDSL